MQQRIVLTVQKRDVLGKKVKKLRREGILPANIYGKDVKSQAVQLPEKEFEKVYKEVGETGLIDIKVDGKTRPVLIHNLQLDYLTHKPLHADFFQVNLKEKIKTMVPIQIIGEPKAVSEKIGMLLAPLSEVEVEALPEDLPEHIKVNVEKLEAVNQQIIVSDLKTPKGVEILTDKDQVVVKISELVSKEAQEQAAAEQAAKEAAAAEKVAEEGAEEVKEAEAKEEPKEETAQKAEEPKKEETKTPQS